MVEEIIGFSTGHDLGVPLGDITDNDSGVHLTIPKNPDLLVNDYTGSSYPTEVHCIEEIIIELHKYEFVQPPLLPSLLV